MKVILATNISEQLSGPIDRGKTVHKKCHFEIKS